LLQLQFTVGCHPYSFVFTEAGPTGKTLSRSPGFMAELGQPIGFVADIVAAVGQREYNLGYLNT